MEEFKQDSKAVDIGNQVKNSVAALRGFFEETIQSHREKQKRYIGKKLVEIQQTMGRGKKRT